MANAQKARSARELAGRLAPPFPTSERQIARLLSRTDCPFDSNVRDHPIEVSAFQRWYVKVVSPNKPGAVVAGLGDGGGTRQRAELQYLLERALLVRKRREILDDQYIRTADHVAGMVDYTSLVRNKLEEWIQSVPAAIEGLDEAQVAAVRLQLRDNYDRLCEDMQSLESIPAAAAPRAEQRKDPKKAKAGAKRRSKRRNAPTRSAGRQKSKRLKE